MPTVFKQTSRVFTVVLSFTMKTNMFNIHFLSSSHRLTIRHPAAIKCIRLSTF